MIMTNTKMATVGSSVWHLDGAAGLLLLLGFVANFAGVLMFWWRDGTSGAPPPSASFYLWERTLILTAVVPTAIGFMLLTGYLNNTAGHVLASIGALAYFFAAILLVIAETLALRLEYKTVYPLMIIYVVMAFLAQALLGGALRQAGLLAVWIGWATICWNLGWLLILPVITPQDIYFPVLHHLMPLFIGVALLWGSKP